MISVLAFLRIAYDSVCRRKIYNERWHNVLRALPVLFYYPMMEILTNGQTVGKKIMGIRVITLEGGQASISQYLFRWMFRTADFPIWIFFAIFSGATALV